MYSRHDLQHHALIAQQQFAQYKTKHESNRSFSTPPNFLTYPRPPSLSHRACREDDTVRGSYYAPAALSLLIALALSQCHTPHTDPLHADQIQQLSLPPFSSLEYN